MADAYFDPWDEPAPTGPHCEQDGEVIDTYGAEHYWQCGHPGTVAVPSSRLLCEDHAGKLGYGPKQEYYGYDPADGFDPSAYAGQVTP